MQVGTNIIKHHLSFLIFKAFLSKLYTYLVDEMHTALSKIFTIEDSAPSPPIIVDCDMLRQYATEAEVN